jgi:outer membrane biosynthesis protein TonB
MPDLTLDQMKDVIANGGSVLFNPTAEATGGRIAVRADDLPSEADLARRSGDPAAKSAAREALQKLQEKIAADIEALDAPEPAPAAEPAKPSPAPAPAPATPPAPAVKVAPLPEPKPEPKGK